MIEKIKSLITLLDTKGRGNPENNSVMLWKHEWDELRRGLHHLLIAAQCKAGVCPDCASTAVMADGDGRLVCGCGASYDYSDKK